MNEPRRVYLKITYNNTDVTNKFQEYISSFSYVDCASGESDTIDISLIDREKKWLGKWIPNKGDNIQVKINVKNWSINGENKTFNCGNFLIDELTASGRPLKCKIGAISSPINSFKTKQQDKVYEGTNIKEIAKKIATKYKLELIYDANDINIRTLEQNEETDCVFINNLCETYGLGLKIYSDKLIIYDKALYEKKKSILTIKESDVSEWEYTTTITKTYTGVEFSYTPISNSDNKTSTSRISSSDKDDISVFVGQEGRVLKMNGEAFDEEDAKLRALAQVNNANEKMVVVRLTMLANIKLVASSNVTLEGFSKKFDGKYVIDKVTHHIQSSSGYEMSLDLRKIITRISLEDNEKSKNIDNAKKTPMGDTATKENKNKTTKETYIVKRGDTLWDIANKFYGDSSKYQIIYEANKDNIEKVANSENKNNSDNGYWIWEGTELIIPDIGTNTDTSKFSLISKERQNISTSNHNLLNDIEKNNKDSTDNNHNLID